MDNFPSNHQDIAAFFAHHHELCALATVFFSLLVTLIVMPRVIAISKAKNLIAQTNNRTSHKGIVPTLGGVGVFTGLLLTVNIAALVFASYGQLIDLVVFNILVLLLLLIGVSDDLMPLAPRKKMAFLFAIACIFAVATNIQIISFSGLFGIQNIPNYIGLPFSVFVMVLIINAYNLIDGIDGLAGVLGAVISAVLAVTFYVSGHFFYALISLSLVGSLSAFLVYNFSHQRKIFLGDTGSMVVGFVLAFQIVLFLSLGAKSQADVFKNAPIFVMALLSYPLLDTLRVFMVRIRKGKNPFLADRNHIHHHLIDLGLSHKYATLAIGCYTIIMTALAYATHDLSINVTFAFMLPTSMLLLGLPFCIKRTKNKYIFGLPTF
ncbi:glycosyltransferase family 4 protein [Bizionia sediminis]|uniref:Glycosyltransferase family 4 protein n=1 Tax=Bizionia sediminis TaxID=1737064 RepID=A0ABW5KUW7_9FLAO